jgi:hypothetical protein
LGSKLSPPATAYPDRSGDKKLWGANYLPFLVIVFSWISQMLSKPDYMRSAR